MSYSVISQVSPEYDGYITEAESMYKTKNYKASATAYEKHSPIFSVGGIITSATIFKALVDASVMAWKTGTLKTTVGAIVLIIFTYKNFSRLINE